jgi:hypothetical protein
VIIRIKSRRAPVVFESVSDDELDVVIGSGPDGSLPVSLRGIYNDNVYGPSTGSIYHQYLPSPQTVPDL